MKLPSCYVLIEPLNVPHEENFVDVGESAEETVAILNLNEESCEDSEPEESLIQNKSERNQRMRESLPSLLRSKIIS